MGLKDWVLTDGRWGLKKGWDKTLRGKRGGACKKGVGGQTG